MTNDPALLQRYANEGSDEAFAELVRNNVDFVYAAALRFSRNPARAEDISQIVFITLARKAKGLVGRAELAGWLYIATRYTAGAMIRSDICRQKYEADARLMELLASDPNPGPNIDGERLQSMLDEVLADLGDADRTTELPCLASSF